MSPQRQSYIAARGWGVAQDKRAEPRHPNDPQRGWSARLTSDAGVPLSGHVRDLSYRGIGLIVEEELPVGTELTVDLADRHRLPVARKRLRVIHTAPLPSGGFRVGCQFLTPLAYDQLGRLLQ